MKSRSFKAALSAFAVMIATSVFVCLFSLTAKADYFEKDSFKVLSIGNSFSTNATTYLYDIAKDAGLDNIVIGNLFIGGCDIKTHRENARLNSDKYTYVKTENDTQEKKQNVTMLSALLDEKWDYVVLQQASHYSGIESTYNEDLDALINYVKLFSPLSQIAWHMTWTYTEDSTLDKFSFYDNNSETMYYSIVGAAINQIIPRNDISYIIPSGTVIENLKTSYIRENMYRDDKHMNDLGCYAVGLAFVSTLKDVNIEDITWVPESKYVMPEYLSAVEEAVINAKEEPFVVTASHYKCNHKKSPDGIINTLIEIPEIKATCTHEGLTEGVFCFGCDKFIKKQETIKKKAHSYTSWKTAVKATMTKDGYRTRSCKNCSKSEKQTVKKISSISILSPRVYTGKNIKPTVVITDSSGNKLRLNTDYTVTFPKAKQVGAYTLKITFKGKYYGSAEKTFKIVPKAVSIASVNAKKGGFCVTWKKASADATGYELQYSTSKDFSAKETKKINIGNVKTLTKTVTKLKGNTNYYIRVRTYKTVGKVKYYSSWSNVVKIRTLK